MENNNKNNNTAASYLALALLTNFVKDALHHMHHNAHLVVQELSESVGLEPVGQLEPNHIRLGGEKVRRESGREIVSRRDGQRLLPASPTSESTTYQSTLTESSLQSEKFSSCTTLPTRHQVL